MDNHLEKFQEIYTTFQPKIQRYLTRLVGETEAEDLTQEVFIKVGQALESFRGEASLSTWLYRIATNAALDRLRSPAFRQAALEPCIEASPPGDETEVVDQDAWSGEKTPSIEQQFVRDERDACILRFIQRLPENYHMVVVLSEMERLSNQEVAEILGVTLETVKIRLHRARARLKEDFETQCEYYWAEEVD